jgi:hypothetical protein
MATSVERPRRELEDAPPLGATAAVEQIHGIIYVKDTVSRALINKSNTQVSNLLAVNLKACLKLAKTAAKSVASWPKAFNAAKRIAGGI